MSKRYGLFDGQARCFLLPGAGVIFEVLSVSVRRFNHFLRLLRSPSLLRGVLRTLGLIFLPLCLTVGCGCGRISELEESLAGMRT